jgi:hypothetical protein
LERVGITRRARRLVAEIREALGEIATAWAKQLGPKRFA